MGGVRVDASACVGIGDSERGNGLRGVVGREGVRGGWVGGLRGRVSSGEGDRER